MQRVQQTARSAATGKATTVLLPWAGFRSQTALIGLFQPIGEDMRPMIRKVVLAVAGCAAAVMLVASQVPPAQKPSFEVASVKRSGPDARSQRLGSAGGRFFATNVTLRLLLVIAFNRNDGTAFLNNRIIGGPTWIDTDRFSYLLVCPY